MSDDAVKLARTVADRYRLHTVIAGTLQDDANTLAKALLAAVEALDEAVSYRDRYFQNWNDAALERDAYRSMLCDLLSNKPTDPTALLWVKARALLATSTTKAAP